MNRRGVGHILAAALVLGAAGVSHALTVDEALEKMSAKADTVKDLYASAAVTRYDPFFEEKHTLRLDLFYRKPDLSRVDTYRTRQGREVHTEQVITGKDFIVRVWLETKHGERRKVDPEELKRQREDRNDPFTFFTRKPDDLKKDFDVVMVEPSKPGKVMLRVTPKSKDVQFDYRAVDLTVDTATWLPAAIKTTARSDEQSWSLYEFTKVQVNTGLKDAVFEPPAGIKVEEVGGPDTPKKNTIEVIPAKEK